VVVGWWCWLVGRGEGGWLRQNEWLVAQGGRRKKGTPKLVFHPNWTIDRQQQQWPASVSSCAHLDAHDPALVALQGVQHALGGQVPQPGCDDREVWLIWRRV